MLDTFAPERVRVLKDAQWEEWEIYLSNQQEHECPADCKGKGCHIEQKMLDCPPLSEWRHGL
jgi:hypothetical protein